MWKPRGLLKSRPHLHPVGSALDAVGHPSSGQEVTHRPLNSFSHAPLQLLHSNLFRHPQEAAPLSVALEEAHDGLHSGGEELLNASSELVVPAARDQHSGGDMDMGVKTVDRQHI